jgi:beta-glucosidase
VQGSGEGAGYRVYVDDKPVIDDWSVAKAFQDHTVLQLSKGSHKVVAEDFQSSAFGGRLRLAIANPSKLVSEAARKLAVKCDAVIIAVGYSNDSESEGGDRTFTLPVGQDELIRELSSQSKNTIVIVTSGGNVDSTSWLMLIRLFQLRPASWASANPAPQQLVAT